MEKFKLDILGQEWCVCMCDKQEEARLIDCMGFVDWTSRRIVLASIPEDTNLDNPIMMMCKALRHEIVHAFMFSSGLGDDWTHPAFGHDETTVDWIAYHLDRMALTCCEAESKLAHILLEEKHERDRTDPEEH